jgi:hypothetical protein
VVTQDERYRSVTSMVRYHHAKISESFRLYVILASAIVIASAFVDDFYHGVWTSGQWARCPLWLLALAAITTITMIVANLTAWWGFRREESALTDGGVRPPSFPRSCVAEIVMIAVVVVATAVLGAPWMSPPN